MGTIYRSLFSLLIILSPLVTSAQVVNIPDSIFLVRLIEEGVDTNGDGLIQTTEALAVKKLNVSGPRLMITSLSGIEEFKNLESFAAASNLIDTIDLSELSRLKTLALNNNNLRFIDMSSNDSLEYIYLDANKLTDIDLSKLAFLKELHCGSNDITSINVQKNLLLEKIGLTGNNLTEINVELNLNLTSLSVGGNNISNLDLSNNENISNLNCGNNNLSELNLIFNPNIYNLDINDNNLSEIDISHLNELRGLSCQRNQLTNLDVSYNVNLESLDCDENNLTELNVTKNILLKYLSCSYMQIDSIDLSFNHELEAFYITYCNIKLLDLTSNPKLKYLYCYENLITTLDLRQNPSLEFIGIVRSNHTNNITKVCTNEDNHSIVQNHIRQEGFFDVTASIFCANSNLTFIPYIKRGFTNCDSSSNLERSSYLLTTNADTFTINIENSVGLDLPSQSHDIQLRPLYDTTFWNIIPSDLIIDSVYIASNIFNDTLRDTFCLLPKVDTTQLEISIYPLNIARPGFESCYKIIYRNAGSLPSSDTIKLGYPGNFVTFTNSSEDTIILARGKIGWVYENLHPFEDREIEVCFRLNSPMDNPPLNDGDTLKFKATICPVEGDMTPEDNVAVLCQRVVNSKDPNDKLCLEGETISPDMLDGFVHYMVRFENTGSAEAVNVLVRDIIDTSTFDINSFYTVDASHAPLTTKIYDGRIVEFEFKDIYLPFDDDNNDGYVVFAIKTKDHITIGDSLSNQADIFFDFNFPITTNHAVSVVRNLPTFVTGHDYNLDLNIYPNPTSDLVKVAAKDLIESISIYTQDGRMVRNEVYLNGIERSREVNMQTLPSGIYFLKVESLEGVGIVKVVKN